MEFKFLPSAKKLTLIQTLNFKAKTFYLQVKLVEIIDRGESPLETKLTTTRIGIGFYMCDI